MKSAAVPSACELCDRTCKPTELKLGHREHWVCVDRDACDFRADMKRRVQREAVAADVRSRNWRQTSSSYWS